MVRKSSSFGLRSVRGGVTPRTGFLGAMGTNALSVISLRTGRFLEGPEFGLAHYFWAGPHNSPSKLRFLSPSEEKSGVLMLVSGWK